MNKDRIFLFKCFHLFPADLWLSTIKPVNYVSLQKLFRSYQQIDQM